MTYIYIQIYIYDIYLYKYIYKHIYIYVYIPYFLQLAPGEALLLGGALIRGWR